jgi:LacI family transcriptional regulator
MDWRIPADVAFVSVDRSPDYPETAGFNQRHDIHGALAIDVLVGQLNSNMRGLPEHPMLHLVDGQWEDGDSAPGVRR